MGLKGRRLAVAVFAILALTAGCDSAYREYGESTEERRSDWETSAPQMTREDALDEAAALQQGMTYSDLGEPYGCTEDCSGHEAGAAWAADNDLRDPGDCGGRSQSFVEGCQAYTEALQEAADEIEQRDF